MKNLNWLRMPRQMMLIVFLCAAGASALEAQNYGFMYITNGTTTSSPITAGNWYTIGSEDGAGDDFIAGPLSGWDITTTNKLTATSGTSKRYLVQVSLSFGGEPTAWDIGISINGVAPSDLLMQRTIGSKDQGNVTGCAHLTLSSGDFLELKAKPAATGSIKPYYAQVSVVELNSISDTDYGGMTISGNTTAQTLSSSGVYETLTGFSAVSELKGWTAGTNLLTAEAESAGTYFVTFSASYVGSGPNDNSSKVYTMGVSLDGANPASLATIRATSESDIGNVGGCGILAISAGKTLSMKAFASANSAPITVNYANLSFYKISGTTTSSYGGMTRTTDQTVTLTQDTWTEVPNLSSKTLNNWTFESNGLHATTGTLSAGMYFLKYSASVDASSSGSNIAREFSLGIYVGGSLHTPTRINRKLSSNTDIGALGGVSLINIDSDTDIIKFMIMNSTDGGTLTVKKASIILHLVEDGPTIDGSLPVELSRWEGSSGQGDVKLEWTTESEIENQGFIIERKTAGEREFTTIASYLTDQELMGQGSTTRQTDYLFIDGDVSVGQRYDYRLSDVDYKGKITPHESTSVVVTLDDNTQQPGSLSLMHAYPNPFNPATTIEYAISQASQVNLTIYDLSGNRIAELVQGPQEAGWHSVVWNGLNHEGQPIPTGVYLANLQDQSHSSVIKITYLK